MKFHIVTIFPEFFRGPFEHGVVQKAREAGLIEIHVHDLRTWTYDRHRTVDDRPFGGSDPPAALFYYSRNRAARQLSYHPQYGSWANIQRAADTLLGRT